MSLKHTHTHTHTHTLVDLISILCFPAIFLSPFILVPKPVSRKNLGDLTACKHINRWSHTHAQTYSHTQPHTLTQEFKSRQSSYTKCEKLGNSMLLGFDRSLIVDPFLPLYMSNTQIDIKVLKHLGLILMLWAQEQLMHHYGLILKGEVCHSRGGGGSFNISLISWKINSTPLHKSCNI